MSKSRIIVLVAVGIFALVFVTDYFLVPDRNPPERNSGLILTKEGDAILKRSCFDCHSNETVWPWYSNVPPASLLVYLDVHMGRKHVNFSSWDSMPDPLKRNALKKILTVMKLGVMPWPPYLIMHGDVDLSREDKVLLRADVIAKLNSLQNSVSHN